MSSYAQDPNVEKDIKSPVQLLKEAEKVRSRRQDMSPLHGPMPPIIQVFFGYDDGKVDAFDFNMTLENKQKDLNPGEEGDKQKDKFLPKKGEVQIVKGNVSRFQKSEAGRELATREDETKAQALFNRVDIKAVYPSLERQAVKMLGRHEMYRALYQRVTSKYVSKGTAAIGWEQDKKKFTLILNRTFLVYMTVHNLVNGYPQSTLPKLAKLYDDSNPLAQDLSVAGFTLYFVLLHEMGHIYFKHCGKRGGLYQNFDHAEVNFYGDVLINNTITKMESGKVNDNLIPPIGLGRERSFRGSTPDARTSMMEFLRAAGKFVKFYPGKSEGPGPEKFVEGVKAIPASMLVIFNPGGLVALGVTTATLLYFFRTATRIFNLDPPKKIIEAKKKDQPPPEPKVIRTPVRPGQIVIVKSSGETAVVSEVGVPVGDDEGNVSQDISVVLRRDLPRDVQQEIDQAIEDAAQPLDILDGSVAGRSRDV